MNPEIIRETPGKSSFGVSKPLFVCFRAAPLVIAFLLAYLRFQIIPSALLTILACLVDLFFTKEYFGLGLVGLRWYRNKDEKHQFPNLVFYSKPLPFVASTIDSNIFWLGLLLSNVGWVLFTIFFGFIYGFFWALICIICAVLNFCNFSAFMNCHNAGKEQADSIARNLLLDKNVSFQAAKEENELSSTSEDIEEEEDKVTILQA